jgi:spore maturation protein CgeB
MRIVAFYHSLLSDWNHGNAHFLRGIVAELLSRGHDVAVYEPRDAWSLQNLIEGHGDAPVERFRQAYPEVATTSVRYDLSTLDLDHALEGADVVIVHEWSDHSLVARIGRHRARGGKYRLLFHDTHHRAITAPEQMAAYDLSHYDGVLAYGTVLRNLYLDRGWAARAWTWHEAADTRVFHPPEVDDEKLRVGDVVWIGNWGDDERTAELHEFLIDPVADLKLKARVHGVRYPDEAKAALAKAGIEYAGWLPNFDAPATFARFKATVHVPRGPYVKALRGIPTIRPFEALACGIPLVSAPWDDVEGLFRPGEDYLVARNGTEMKQHLRTLVNEPAARRKLAARGLETIHARHTCGHRVDELMRIVRELAAAEDARAKAAREPRTPSEMLV